MLGWVPGWKRVEENMFAVGNSSPGNWATIHPNGSGISGAKGKRAPACSRNADASIVGSHARRFTVMSIAPAKSWDAGGEAFFPSNSSILVSKGSSEGGT